MELLKCLQTNQALLGNQCLHLGKIVKAGWLGYYKVFLAHDKKGWHVVKLNLVQLFLRKVFGFYKETHLNPIIPKCRKLSADQPEIAACQDRMQALWNKKYVVGLGNSNIDQAQIICFAEKHTDDAFRASLADFIDAHYQEGDVVLVEGMAANEIEVGKNNEQTEFTKRNYIVQGWEPVHFDNLPGNVHALATLQHRQFIKHFHHIDQLCQAQLTDEQLSLVERELEDFINSMSQLHTYYEIPSETHTRMENMARTYLNKIREKELPARAEEARVFMFAIYSLVEKLRDAKWEALERNAKTPEMVQYLNQRNESLINEIAKYRQLNKRVFVIAGPSHFLKFPPPFADCQKVKEELKKHAFLILTNNTYIDQMKLKPLNVDLAPQALR